MTQTDPLIDAAVDFARALGCGLVAGDWSDLPAAEHRLQSVAVSFVLASAIPASSGAATELDYYSGVSW